MDFNTKVSEIEDRIVKLTQRGSYYFTPATIKAWNSKIHYETYEDGYFIESVKGWDGNRKYHILYLSENGVLKRNYIWYNELNTAKKALQKRDFELEVD